MIVYLKCAWANVYTRMGYVFLGTTLLLCTLSGAEGNEHLILYALAPGTLSFCCLLGTVFGVPTRVTYLITRDHLEEYQHEDPRYANIMEFNDYCARAGYRLAVKEFRNS